MLLTPLQILWINLVTDGLLTLAVESGSGDIMQRPPIKLKASIFIRDLGF
ncbi:cation-transporting ATPase PacL homolog [Thermostichus vulcanus NIES-2134]|nr:cation-transporting ATPase PacL homolog [Thermostichus vulcanus NIES-2134]